MHWQLTYKRYLEKWLLFPYEYDLLGANPNTYQSCIIGSIYDEHKMVIFKLYLGSQ
jgi:hypothetical protein